MIRMQSIKISFGPLLAQCLQSGNHDSSINSCLNSWIGMQQYQLPSALHWLSSLLEKYGQVAGILCYMFISVPTYTKLTSCSVINAVGIWAFLRNRRKWAWYWTWYPRSVIIDTPQILIHLAFHSLVATTKTPTDHNQHKSYALNIYRSLQ